MIHTFLNFFRGPRAVDASSASITHTVNNAEAHDEIEDVTTANEVYEDEIQGTGTVTTLEECLTLGMIDGAYFFPKSIAGPEIKKGSKVNFVATYSQITGSWEVIQIQAVPSDLEIQQKELRKNQCILGKIIDINHKRIKVKYGRNDSEDVQTVPAAYFPTDYKLMKGDFLRLYIGFNDPDDENAGGKIISVEPTNRKTVVGQIKLNNGRLTIDNYIYFTDDVCSSGWRPKIRDYVTVDSIESQQEFYSWRALSIVPSNLNSYTFNDKESDGWLERGNCWSESLETLLNDKDSIRILPERNVSFGRVKVGSSINRSVEIRNTSHDYVILHRAIFRGNQSVCKFTFDNLKSESEDVIAVLESRAHYSLTISCCPEMLGSTREMLVFDFGNFQIGRYLTVIATPDESVLLCDGIKEETGQTRNWKNIRSEERISQIAADLECPTVRGIHPVRAPFFIQKRIPMYTVPRYMWTILKYKDEADLFRRHPGVCDKLNIRNFSEKFQVCLWLEEMENDMLRRQYDLDNVILRRSDEYFRFDVPQLRDIHPPVIIGEPLHVFDRTNPKRITYEGFIYQIRGNSILAKFSEQFNSMYKGTCLTVQFRLSRTQYKRCHFAIEQAVRYLGEDWLFPKKVECKPPRIPFIEIEDSVKDDTNQIPKDAEDSHLKSSEQTQNTANSTEPVTLNLFDRKLKDVYKNPAKHQLDFGFQTNKREFDRRATSMSTNFVSDTQGPSGKTIRLKWFNKKLNTEQKEAVRRILRAQGRPLPYIVFGPPGTGKTVTVVEAIIQIYTLDPNSRILAVAPSNSAADVIAMNLVASKQFGIGDFIRLIGFLRQEWQVPETIRYYCVDGDHLETVARHRLIVSTCITAGQFFQLGLSTGHFTHVFVDEAGYCTEPEAVVPCTLVALGKAGQVVLAGDPKQLGPVLMSDDASKLELSLSFLERLMSLPMYSRDELKFPLDKYNPIVLTKLVKNYRAHPILLKLPSKLFYDDELEAAADEESISLCETLKFTKRKGIPLLFHGIQGKCLKDPDSPSWYNTAEVIEVVEYVRNFKSAGVDLKDIGIITPYRKQVEKLRRALELGLLSEEIPKVGSVEEFQGSERRVMIMSLVRSAGKRELEKVIDRFAFVFAPKRFNVSITRAKAFLVVLGNPHVLVHDDIWKIFLKYCLELGCYTGCDLPQSLDCFNGQHFLESLDVKNQMEF